MRAAWLVALAACTSSPHAPAAPVQNVAPRPSPDAYDVTAAELGDAAVMERIHHRARVRQLGRHVLHLGAKPDDPSRSSNDLHLVLPVLGEQGDHVRLVTDDDDARIAIWVERADLALTVTAATEIAPGITLEPGADVDVQPSDGTASRGVVLRDDALVVTGRAPGASLGTVWIEPPPREVVKGTAGALAANVEIRGDASPTAPPIARTAGSIAAVRVAERPGGWIEIAIDHERVRVRGFVLASTFDPGVGFLGGGSFEGGYGISDTDRLTIGAGTCLYDASHGDVVGVNRKTRERYGYRARGSDWAGVYVNTPWDLVVVSLSSNGGGCRRDAAPR